MFDCITTVTLHHYLSTHKHTFEMDVSVQQTPHKKVFTTIDFQSILNLLALTFVRKCYLTQYHTNSMHRSTHNEQIIFKWDNNNHDDVEHNWNIPIINHTFSYIRWLSSTKNYNSIDHWLLSSSWYKRSRLGI